MVVSEEKTIEQRFRAHEFDFELIFGNRGIKIRNKGIHEKHLLIKTIDDRDV